MQVARSRLDQVVNLRGRLTSRHIINSQQMEAARGAEANMLSPQLNNLPPTAQTVMSPATSKTTEEEKKAAAAAVAAKLAASTSSAQMLTSVLSSLVAEEAASMGGASKSAGFSSALSMFPPEKRPKLEKPMSISDAGNSEAGGSAYFTSLQQQSMGNVPVTLSSSMQSISQTNQMQTPFQPPAAPPPPPGPPSSSPTNQFASPGLMAYGYGSSTLPPPPPPLLSQVTTMGLAIPGPPHSSQTQQQPSNGGYYRPPGIGFYGQSHQSTPPPVPRQ